MTPTHARSPVGERAYATRPKKSSNISLVGAVRVDEMASLYPYDGAIDGERFLSFLDQQLVPILKPGDVVIMDNLRVHHIDEVEEVINNAGAATLFLPPYSPELNPIEETWSQIKRDFRTAEPRTISEMIEVMKESRASISKENLRAYFKHAGYS